MASSKEVLKEWLKQGNYLDDNSVIDSLYKMKAPTDELAEHRFLDMYGNVAPFDKADRIEEPTIPSMDNVIAILGLSDDPKEAKDARTKEQKFIEEFPKKANEWKKKIINNPVYGKNGWKTVRELWRQATRDKMQADIVKARKEAMDDAPLDFGLFKLPNISGSSFVTRMVFPRTTEHLENAGDYTFAKDILGDIAENAAMTVPGSAFTGIAGKGLAKVAPKAVKYFSGPGSNIVEGAVKGAGRMAGNLLGNAVVPFGAEAMDAAIYDDDDDGMEQRADFSAGDAAIGAAINQGVNRGILRMGGPLIDSFSPGGIAEGGTEKFRQFLENFGRSFRQKGDDYAADVARRVDTPVIAEAGEITPKGLSSAVHGGSDIVPEGQSRQALEQALSEQAVLKAIDRGELAFQPKVAQSTSNWIKGQGTSAELKKAITELDDAIKNGATHESTTKAAMKAAIADAVSSKETATPVTSMFKPKYKDGIRGGDVPLTADVLKKVIEKNPAPIINYAHWHGNGGVGDTDRIWNEMKNTWKRDKNKVLPKRILNVLKQGWDSGYGDLTLNVLNQAIPAWGVNKIGSESDANLILSPLPNLKEALNESRQEVHEAPKKRKAAADVLRIVSEGDSLTADDRKYLDAIAKNPDIMKFGYKDDPDGFRLWLLERGNRLLQGTSAYRPTFPVE